MILYKYVPFDVGVQILTTNTLGFSQPQYFNDPFDQPVYPFVPGDDLGSENIRKAQVEHRLRIMRFELAWAECAGILCLTRTPTNPLMWAHYAEGHKGVVIGIDAVWAGLTDEDCNLIPAQYGSVIYVSRRSQEPFITAPPSVMTIGETRNFLSGQYERLQRLFLHKPLCWSYEEEVRVVKSIDGIPEKGGETQSGRFSVVTTKDSRPLYLYSMPPGSIREVYFGIRAADEASDTLYEGILKHHPQPHLTVYECTLDTGGFSVGHAAYISNAEAMG